MSVLWIENTKLIARKRHILVSDCYWPIAREEKFEDIKGYQKP